METRRTYFETKLDYQILEQQIRHTKDAALLPGLNFQLEQLAIAVEDTFHNWSDDVDDLLSQPVVPEIPVTHQLVVAGWCQSEDMNQTPGAA